MKKGTQLKPGIFDILINVPAYQSFTTADIRKKIHITLGCYYKLLKELKEKDIITCEKKNPTTNLCKLTEKGRTLKSAVMKLKENKLL